jgi:hypothetical protein
MISTVNVLQMRSPFGHISVQRPNPESHFDSLLDPGIPLIAFHMLSRYRGVFFPTDPNLKCIGVCRVPHWDWE